MLITEKGEKSRGGDDEGVEPKRIGYRLRHLWPYAGSSQRSRRGRGKGTSDEKIEIKEVTEQIYVRSILRNQRQKFNRRGGVVPKYDRVRSRLVSSSMTKR